MRISDWSSDVCSSDLDDVDWHWNRIFAGAVLTTLLGVGAELAAPENRQDGNRIVIAGRDSAQDSINQVGQEITRRNMNIQPTLTERPGLDRKSTRLNSSH